MRRRTEDEMGGMCFWGKPITDMDREELYGVIHFLARRVDDLNSPENVQARALGEVEMSRRGLRQPTQEDGLASPRAHDALADILGDQLTGLAIMGGITVRRGLRTLTLSPQDVQPGDEIVSGHHRYAAWKEAKAFPDSCHHCHQVECACPPCPPAPPSPGPYGVKLGESDATSMLRWALLAALVVAAIIAVGIAGG